MDVFVANYAHLSEYEAECDNLSLLDGGVEGLAAPSVSMVFGSLDSVRDLRSLVATEARDAMAEDGTPPEVEWHGPAHRSSLMSPFAMREHWIWELWTVDGDHIATLVVQRMEVS